ncbi:MAG: YcxB family protein [Cyanobacteria bacterium P01_E01_bin.42]
MKIEFRLNFRDYQEANKAHVRQHKIIYFAFWSFIIVLLLSATGKFLRGDLIGGILTLLLAITLNPLSTLLETFWLKRSWNNQNKALHQPMTIEATGESFSLEGEGFDATIRCNLFKKFIETNNLFIIYEGDNAFRIIPKRAFTNNEELAEFRIILHENINSNH